MAKLNKSRQSPVVRESMVGLEPQFSELFNDSLQTYKQEVIKSEMQLCEKSHSTIGKSTRYKEEDTMNFFYVFSHLKGSLLELIIRNKLFLIEQLIYASIIISLSFFNTNFKDSYLAENEKLLGSLSTFLLALYLSLCMSRWWRLRTNGVGNMWSVCNNMPIRLNDIYYSFIHKYPHKYTQQLLLLNQIGKIKRYIQLSLSVLFVNGKQIGFEWKDLIQRGIITEYEVNSLKKQGGTWSESIWNWIWREINLIKLNGLYECYDNDYESALIKDELMRLVFKGRGGSGLIMAQLNCRLPFIYVHCVSFIIKLNNIMLCLSAGSWVYHDFGIFTLIIAVIFIQLITIIFNTIIIIGQHVQNPFSNNVGSFPGLRYENGFGNDFEIMLQFNIHKQAKQTRDNRLKMIDQERDQDEDCDSVPSALVDIHVE